MPGGHTGIERLTAGCEATVLDFLSSRPAHTAYLAGLIHMNGLESPANRGAFYAYRNRRHAIEGVALIGHAVAFEANSPDATTTLARLAGRQTNTILIRIEQDKKETFWRSYAEVGHAASSACQEHLLELNTPSPSPDSDYDLRPAMPDELDQVFSMNVELTLAERGNDPLKFDAEGLRQRLLRRIQRKQVWVWLLRGKVIFKAEIITRTPETVYLEGIYVQRDERGKGHGVRSMQQLGHILLSGARSLCLFVNESNHTAQALYRKAGYRTVGHYETIYLQKKPAS